MSEDARTDLVSHLDELRGRLLRSAIYVVTGAVAVWVCFDSVYSFLARPITSALQGSGAELNYGSIFDPFLIKVQISLVGGLILALPLVIYEAWAFVAPGLTRRERRVVRPIIPASMLLFAMGVAMAYLLTTPSMHWMMGFRAPDTRALINLRDTLLMVLKFYLAFGLGFQLPIVLVLLAALGIVDSRLLTRYWREATVAIFIIAAVITPTWDPLTMTVAALPMVFLYLATIGIIRLIERQRVRQAAREAAGAPPR